MPEYGQDEGWFFAFQFNLASQRWGLGGKCEKNAPIFFAIAKIRRIAMTIRHPFGLFLMFFLFLTLGYQAVTQCENKLLPQIPNLGGGSHLTLTPLKRFSPSRFFL